MGVIEDKCKQAFPTFFFEIHDVNQPGNWFKGMLLQVHVIKFKRAVENKDANQRQAVPVYIETRSTSILMRSLCRVFTSLTP